MLLLILLIACADLARTDALSTCPEAESVRLHTSDGAPIQLHRHPGDGQPVLVVHGISSNHRCWDLSPERSLAVALAEAGYDAWLLDLRGHGDAIVPEARTHGWTVDDYGGRDMHRAITHIQGQTGAERVAIVGHSMGGGATITSASNAAGSCSPEAKSRC